MANPRKSAPTHRVLAVSPVQTMLSDWNDILDILGAKAAIWPFFESTDQIVTGLPAPGDDLIPTAAAAVDLNADFSPMLLFGGIHSYFFNPVGDHHLNGPDHADFSFATGGFSVGAWVNTSDIAAARSIMAKYDSAGAKEEWKFAITSAGLPELELHDASASASEIGTGAPALVAGRWYFLVATFDGVDATPAVNFYYEGAQDGGDATTTESGTFVAMEAGAAPLTIGSAGVTATPTEEWHGRIALPFLAPKELTAANVTDLFRITRKFVGF